MIKVIKSKTKPETTEILAEAIVRIGAAMDQLAKSNHFENRITNEISVRPQ